MRGVNKAIIVGNLGNDPETKYTPAGAAITTISVATSESWKDKQTGQAQEKTEWHRVVFFNKLAEIAGQYLKKGSKVYIEGKLQTKKWTDQNQIERWSTQIIANEMQMLDSRAESASGVARFVAEREPCAGQGADDPAPSMRTEAQIDEAGFDDDIPF